MAHRTLDYLRLDDLVPATRNPKAHDLDLLRRSMARFGFVEPVTMDERTGRLLAGHGRMETLAAAQDAGIDPPEGIDVDTDGRWLLPVVRGKATADDAEADALLVVLNQATIAAGWEPAGLVDLLADLAGTDGGLEATGYTVPDLDAMLAALGRDVDVAAHSRHLTDPDELPPRPTATTERGDVWLLGPHRLACGDSTIPGDVAALMRDDVAALVHADPPYGMGKEADGVLNDNLYAAKLDAFQMTWWATWEPHLTAAASAYVWGNAPDLWRLWYLGGLSEREWMVRNEVVWDKDTIPGMRSPGAHSYPVASERCLLLMRGEQFLGNQNTEDYWPGWDPLRLWLNAEAEKMGWARRDVNRITGTYMAGHWFGMSQFQPINEAAYKALQDAADGQAFTPEYSTLFSDLFPDLRDGGNAHRRDLSAKLRETRSYFDNTHAAMTDVWKFPRVLGDERHGHATPKPVAVVERALLSSSAPGDVVAVPFGGTGPETIAAHRIGRVVRVMELDAGYCDVICRRWERHTGIVPVLEATGKPHEFG